MTRQLQQKIHVACRELGLDQEARRDLQVLACGKSSMRDMDEGDLKLVLKRLEEAGFQAKSSKRRAAAPRADLRYIHVLWRLLGEAGKLNKPGRAGLNAFIRTRFEKVWGSVPLDIDQMQDAAQINAVTRALKDWCHREGIRTEQ